MSEQSAPLADDFPAWPAERGEAAYAPAWVAEGSETGAWMEAEAPRVGETGVARAGADLTRVTLELERAGEQDEATADLVLSTGLRIADLTDRMKRAYRPHAELIEDWHTVESLAADVQAFRQTADWLLDQIALRNAHAQLRAVLEPDITDYLRDRRADGAPLGLPASALDAPRAAHLAQARDTVRAYTAAAHSGREPEAQPLQRLTR